MLRIGSWFSHLIFIGCLCVTLMQPTQAQTTHALLIGNNAYPSAPLKNAIPDAVTFGAALTKAGYSVTVIKDGTRESMLRALQQLASVIAPSDEVVFFYAGHGVQFQERNYLLPVDALVQNEEDVALSSIDLEELLDTLSRTKLKTLMVILDACRNNPFGDRIPVKQKGLAQPQLPPHTLVVYSTAPGETATDEGEGNGIFIQTLVKNMSSTNISVETLLKTVRSEVMQATDDKQVPWDSSTLTERFILVKDFAPGANQSNQELRDRAADLFWESIVSKPDLTNLEEFLSRFETSKHATQAKKMLTNLYSQGDKQIAAAKLDFESSQQVRENWLRQISLLKSQQPKSLNLIKLVTVLAPQLAAEDKSAFDQFEAVLRRKPYHTAIAVSFAQEGVVVNVQHSQSSSSVAKGEALKLCEYQRKGVGDRWPIVCKTVYEDGDWHLSAFVAHFSEMAAIDSAFMFKQVAEELRKLAPRIQGSK